MDVNWTSATNTDATVQLSSDLEQECRACGLLDEISDNFFTIRSICALRTLEGCLITGYLRHASPSLRYPPSDNGVREFLTDGIIIKAEDTSSLIRNFLFAVFENTTQAVKDLGGDKITRVRKFLDFMSRDQHTAWNLPGPTWLNSMRTLIDQARKRRYRFLFVFIFQFTYLTQ